MAQKKELTDKDIDKIINDNLLLKYWELELGIGYVYENAPEGVHYSAPYLELGEAFWMKIKASIHAFICEGREPKEWVNDLITGDIRNLIVGLVSAITSKYDVSMGIAIPIAALVVKTGVINFCKVEPLDNNADINIKDIVRNRTIDKELKQQ